MNSERVPDLYAVMHLEPDCSDEEVRVQWRHFARLFHPDTHAGDPWFEEEFKKLEAAYEVLGNPDRRALYDQQREFLTPQILDFSQTGFPAAIYNANEPETYRQESDDRHLAIGKHRIKLAIAATAAVIALMGVSVVRAVRGAHPDVPESAQKIDGSAVVEPAFEPATDPAIRAKQEALQSRLIAVGPEIYKLIGQGQQTLAALESQDRIDSRSNPAWLPPLDRQRDEATIQADIGELRFQMADIERQIDQMAAPDGVDDGPLEQELESLELPNQPISGDIALAEHDLRSQNARM